MAKCFELLWSGAVRERASQPCIRCPRHVTYRVQYTNLDTLDIRIESPNSDHPNPSEPIRTHPNPIRTHPNPSEPIRTHPNPSEPIRIWRFGYSDHPNPSEFGDSDIRIIRIHPNSSEFGDNRRKPFWGSPKNGISLDGIARISSDFQQNPQFPNFCEVSLSRSIATIS